MICWDRNDILSCGATRLESKILFDSSYCIRSYANLINERSIRLPYSVPANGRFQVALKSPFDPAVIIAIPPSATLCV